ncbi:MAG: GAF domain-containing protein [Pirellulaceae bacterium]|nr:GAF domain-containing protein [Pirellulaceae bacterium]
MIGSPSFSRRQNDVRFLDLLSQVSPLRRILATLCQSAEQSHKDISVCLLQIDAATQILSVGAAPAFPKEIVQIVKQLGGQQDLPGRSLQRRATSTATNEQLTVMHRRLASLYGFSDYWCAPLRSPTDGKILGMLGFYCQTARSPKASETMSMEAIANLASLFIDRERDGDAWRRRVVSSFSKTCWSLRTTVVVRHPSQEVPGRA